MDFSSVNWLAVVVCVVVSMIVGSLWYSPKVFYNAWAAALGKSQQELANRSNMGMVWALTVAASLVQAVFMALMVNAMGSMTPGGPTLVSGATAGLMLWLGFVAPSSLTNRLFADQLKAWSLESGYHLVTFILFGAILGAWQ